ncbi:DUF3267 domain-containing protein [Planococcus sp. CPCC 101016]|uniref:DUF3267 domain-containing protein n=1 Tax=Planococcus sp. CPCC 101016 TaxID=2599617 RepID=UPI0011B589D7|nr:DUF3267 domain-containing protein [Planococcus sp. CPCC 101016]TWT03363.1 DUF3267 domain-containing protein [Planococcus sp. CPCC 101016]
MHCWKTINVKKQYGFDRLFMISALFGIAVFMASYIGLAIAYATPLSDQYFLFFILGVLAIYPIHKILHFLPMIGCHRSLKLIVRKQMKVCPSILLHINEPVPKLRFLLSLATPFLVLNTLIVILSILMPAFSHYFAMLLAYHCALCLTDIIYLRNLARSPKYALIEETETGFEILVPPVVG